jgi:phenylalanyl-tRNA synthetase alpha chain
VGLVVLNAERIREVKLQVEKEISASPSAEALESVRVKALGKKGEFTLLMKELGSAAPEDRRALGAALNEAKASLEAALEARLQTLSAGAAAQRLQAERIDVTLPVDSQLVTRSPGSLHPLTAVQRELEQIFEGLGFTVVDGPEVEREYYNFDALNIPVTHPARDMQDTFWTEKGDVLRTHTSSMQVRALERIKPPLRIVAPGRVFRYERSDATHEHTFYQMEGMMVDRNITVGHLVYFMRMLLREILRFDPKIRLRPGYFPFVEPGFELDIWFKNRWLELLPCGLVHPRVLEFGGLDPNEWQGFAFGLGLSRLVMSRYQIDDIRHLQGGDLRFLRQFA